MTRHAAADPLSRREREIMDILHRVQPATVAAVRDEMAAPPTYSAVRALLRILEEKGHVRHSVDGPRYLYAPVEARAARGRSALRHLVQTFFDGSVEDAVSALLESGDRKLTRKQLDDLARRIADARKEGR
jgi:predicted transcriptional regulator